MARLFGRTPAEAAGLNLPYDQAAWQRWTGSIGLDRQRQQMELADAYQRAQLQDQENQQGQGNAMAWAKLRDEMQSGDERMQLARQQLELQKRALDIQENYPYDQDFFGQLASDRQLSNNLALLNAQAESNRQTQREATTEKRQAGEAGLYQGAESMAALQNQLMALRKAMSQVQGLNLQSNAVHPFAFYNPWTWGGTTQAAYADTVKKGLQDILRVPETDPTITSIQDKPTATAALTFTLNNLDEQRKSLEAEIQALNKQTGAGLYVQPFTTISEAPAESYPDWALPDYFGQRPMTMTPGETRYRSTYSPPTGINPFIPNRAPAAQPTATELPEFQSQREGQEMAYRLRWPRGTRYLAPGPHGPRTIYQIQ